ncbi:hypothetical protein AD953_00080, partial [Acetobacter malorum]
DNVFELLTFAGRDAPAAKALMIPASVGGNSLMKQSHRDMFAYCNAVMEPWDGPAALCATDGRWVIAGLDRSGLRPLRYTVTDDNLLIVGSETGMVRVPESNVAKRGRLGPGDVIGVDLQEARLYGNEELLDLLASRQDFSSWVGGIQKIGCIVRSDVKEPVLYQGDELRRRQLAVGTTL